jgi:exo-beta-1,3-glucanase (GH17 family)
MFPFAKAVCYSGYRENQSPHTHVYPTEAQVLEDLKILEPYVKYLRMYDPYEHAQTVLRVIRKFKLPFQVMIGVEPRGEISNPNCPWGGLHSEANIAKHKVSNYEQLDLLAKLANEYGDIVLAVAVGNESTSDWHPNLMDPQTIAAHVRYLKAKVKQPVTFCEGGHYWRTKNAAAAKEVDFISIHSYPVWLRVPYQKAIQATKEDYAETIALYKNKPVIFTEYGWPTMCDDKMIQADVNEANQAGYLKAMEKWSETNQVTMFTFEAFDEPWKGSNNPVEPEKHWGMYNVDRTPKQFMKQKR